MLCAPNVNPDVTHSAVAGKVTEAQPGTGGPPTPSVKLTVPKFGTGPAATPVTVTVNVTGTPNSAEPDGFATNVTVGAASAIEYGNTALSPST
jgi:hypothetical protein